MYSQTKKLSVLLAALLIALAGCDEKKNVDAASDAVAAKVNGEAISTQSIAAELAKAGVKNPADVNQEDADRVLNALLEQRLFVQGAKKMGLEKDPQVVRAIEAAQRAVLAQAYVDKVTVGAAKPGEAEINAYYDKHPELFSERRLYRLQEIMIQVGPESIAAVKTRLGSGTNLNDLVEWLKSQNIPARGNLTVKSAEQLPMELLAKLHPLKDGQAIVMENPRQITVLILAGSQTQPMSREQAQGSIERFLTAANRREMAKAELDKLRGAAKIEYVAPYAEAKAGTGAAGHVASEAKPGATEQGVLDKALSGIK